jgi:hypothetical protein
MRLVILATLLEVLVKPCITYFLFVKVQVRDIAAKVAILLPRRYPNCKVYLPGLRFSNRYKLSILKDGGSRVR